MKVFFSVALGVAVAATTFGATIDVSTGVAGWQVFDPNVGSNVAATTLTLSQQNPSWAPAPSGSAWVSYGSNEGTGCTVQQTPGIGCAHPTGNPNGSDTWVYTLTITAAQLGATDGTLNFVFGSDNRVNLFVGNNNPPSQLWTGQPPNNSNGSGFSPLGCSGLPGPTSAGSTQLTYDNCLSTVSFNAASLNGDLSLTLFAYNFNDPIPGCPACGNPTGFVLEGTLLSGVTATPEPATFGLVALAGLAGLALRRKR